MNHWRRILKIALGLAALACSTPRPTGARRPTDSVAPLPPAPVRADSLALRAPGGAEVWFTASRDAVDSAGRACVERVMEIRRDGQRIHIPLLYTGHPPVLLNDSTIRASIWLHCRPGNRYRISLRTGQPLRELP